MQMLHNVSYIDVKYSSVYIDSHFIWVWMDRFLSKTTSFPELSETYLEEIPPTRITWMDIFNNQMTMIIDIALNFM